MKLIEKFLIKRCSTEVQIMLERMKDRPEDFDYGTGWRKLVEGAEGTYPYTSTERKMIRKYWKECQAKRGRRQLLDKIMQQTINPTTREDMEDAMSGPYSARLAASMQATKQALQGGVISGSYMDARTLYGSPLQGRQP